MSAGGSESSPSYGQTLTSAKYKWATLVGCLLSMFQQLSGINFVMFYSSNIMGSLHISPNLITALVGFVNCVSVFPTLYLFKRFGRKNLLWTHSFMIAGTLIALGVCLLQDASSKDSLGHENKVAQYLSIVFLMLFIMLFEFSLGPLIWVYLSEIMTEKGLSLGVGVNQVVTVMIAYFTNPLIKAFGGSQKNEELVKEIGSGRLFLMCGGFTVLCGIFCLFAVKETKGLTDREVSTLYSKDPADNVKIERASYLQLDNSN